MINVYFFKKTNLTLLALLFFSLSAFSQSSTDDLPGLLKAVLENHPTLQAKASDRNAARTAVTIAERQFWPTPSINSDVGPADSSGRTQALTARITYPVFTGGLLTADLESAELRQQIAQYEIDIVAREVAFQFLDLYRNWWFHSARAVNLNKAKQQMDTLRETQQRRTKAGVSPALDLAQAEMQSKRLQDEHRQAIKQSNQALAEMTTLTGQNINPYFFDLSHWPASPHTQVADLTDLVLSTHPSVTTALSQINLAQTELKKIKANALPTISLRAEKQHGSYLGSLSPSSRVYLNTQFTMGAGLAALPMQAQSIARIQAAEEQATAVRLNLSALVQRIWNERAQAAEQMISTANQLAAQKEMAAAGIRLFTAGRRSWQDLLGMQRERQQLMTQQNEAETAYLNANWRLHLLGNTLPQFSFYSP